MDSLFNYRLTSKKSTNPAKSNSQKLKIEPRIMPKRNCKNDIVYHADRIESEDSDENDSTDIDLIKTRC